MTFVDGSKHLQNNAFEKRTPVLGVGPSKGAPLSDNEGLSCDM